MAISGIGFFLEILFVGLASTAFFVMLHLLGTPNASHAKLLRMVHRVAGGIAVALYVVIGIMCIRGLSGDADLPSVMAVRFAFRSLFVPLILMKIVIVEKYPELRNRLFAIGTFLFAVIFVIFLTSAFSQFTYRGGGEATGSEAREALDLGLAKDLFVVKCAKCHRLDRPLSARMSPSDWEATVERMRQKDPSWISESEAARITDFITSLRE
jgi:hypothetical protein